MSDDQASSFGRLPPIPSCHVALGTERILGTKAPLRANHVADVQRVARNRVLVPANQALNIAIEFTTE